MADTHFTPFTPEQVARFWAKVGPPDQNGCRPWLASKMTSGYGQFSVQRRTVGAHRLAWILTYGHAPDAAVFRHSCDHPWCCEPTHITPGTQADNIADAVSRGRIATGDRSGPLTHPEVHRGERHGMAKLTQDQILAIRDALKRGVPQRQIAAEFGVRQQAISKIGSGKLWGWMDGATPIQSARRTSEKLTAETVIAIRQALASGMTQRRASVEFGLCPQHVHRIASGKSWGWLKEHETEESPAPSETTQGRGQSGGSHPDPHS